MAKPGKTYVDEPCRTGKYYENIFVPYECSPKEAFTSLADEITHMSVIPYPQLLHYKVNEPMQKVFLVTGMQAMLGLDSKLGLSLMTSDLDAITAKYLFCQQKRPILNLTKLLPSVGENQPANWWQWIILDLFHYEEAEIHSH